MFIAPRGPPCPSPAPIFTRGPSQCRISERTVGRIEPDAIEAAPKAVEPGPQIGSKPGAGRATQAGPSGPPRFWSSRAESCVFRSRARSWPPAPAAHLHTSLPALDRRRAIAPLRRGPASGPLRPLRLRAVPAGRTHPGTARARAARLAAGVGGWAKEGARRCSSGRRVLEILCALRCVSSGMFVLQLGVKSVGRRARSVRKVVPCIRAGRAPRLGNDSEIISPGGTVGGLPSDRAAGRTIGQLERGQIWWRRRLGGFPRGRIRILSPWESGNIQKGMSAERHQDQDPAARLLLSSLVMKSV